jgi:hypothetical protein
MDLVRDEGEDQEGQTGVVNGESRRIPVKLRGRGGFSHPRGRGRGGSSTAHEAPKPDTASSNASPDPVDSLASSMSALQFVPHSVRMARGRGRGRGGG